MLRNAIVSLALGLIFVSSGRAQSPPEWTRPFPPFRIIRNIPTIGDDYARTFKAQKDMSIDIWLASHASQFGLHKKYKPGDPFDPERFVDPQGFKAEVERLEKVYREQLTKERAR